MDVLQFTPDEVDNIWNALSGIAKLSLLEFSGDEQAQIAGDRALFESICNDFALEPAQLEYALLTHVVELPGNQQVEKKCVWIVRVHMSRQRQSGGEHWRRRARV